MIFNSFFNVLFPPVCPVCSARTDAAGNLCPDCFSALRFVTDNTADQTSAVVYDTVSKQLVLTFKYGDRADLASLLARMMYNSGEVVLNGADMLTCVPLHWKRMLVRKYNQAAVLAAELSKLSCIPSNPMLLKRVKSTPKQGTRKERFENVKNAFALNPKYSIQGKTIVLIDDVFTTGATTQSCTDVLKKGGAKEVRLMTFAKARSEN